MMARLVKEIPLANFKPTLRITASSAIASLVPPRTSISELAIAIQNQRQEILPHQAALSLTMNEHELFGSN